MKRMTTRHRLEDESGETGDQVARLEVEGEVRTCDDTRQQRD